MKTSHRRIALLTGASVSALVIATPAFAAPHDALADGVYPGVSTTTATVTICNLATPPGSPCFFGVIDSVPPSTAVVSTTANGQVLQHAGGATVNITLINAGSAEVGAIALGGATPTAVNHSAIQQTATGANVTMNVTNNGPLLIDALATGSNAHAHVNHGLGQIAGAAATVADLNITNNSTLNVDATAQAIAKSAHATAGVDKGVYQTATGVSSGSNDITNNGSLGVAAIATASGIFASANADVTNGLYQDAAASKSGK